MESNRLCLNYFWLTTRCCKHETFSIEQLQSLGVISKCLFKRAFKSAINPLHKIVLCDLLQVSEQNRIMECVHERPSLSVYETEKNILFSKDLQVFRSLAIMKALRVLHSDPETHLRF